MKRPLVFAFLGVLAAALVVGVGVGHSTSTPASASPTATTMAVSPAAGFTLHIDAVKHFLDHPDEVAHHWCKAVDGLTECQIYDGDGPTARLVAIEMVVPTATWQTFPADEQKLWHYHRVEIPKVNATLPGMSEADAAKVVASLQETYGKIYQLWDPMTSKLPTGNPQVNVLH